jgi:hypothetical protein
MSKRKRKGIYTNMKPSEENSSSNLMKSRNMNNKTTSSDMNDTVMVASNSLLRGGNSNVDKL